MKNRIINGAMVIDQRYAGASVTPASLAYTLDRWRAIMSTAASKFTVQQNAGSVTPPAGFTNYLGVTSSSAYSVVSADQYALQQYVEGYNCADLAWGSASAQSVTLSFWVRSSLTGSFGVVIQNVNSTRSYPILYTITSANTWEYKTIVIPGDTGGATDTTTGRGIAVMFALGTGATYSGTSGSWSATSYSGVTGQVSVVGTSGATWYITGVQVEKGSTATAFDYRPYGTELALCQRYYQLYTATAVEWIYNEDATTNHKWWQCYLTGATMRTAPSATFIGSWTGGTSGGLTGTISSMSVVEVSLNRLVVRVAMSADGGTAHLVYHTDGWATKQIGFTSEL
jgi:hypothetical protein